VARWAEAEPNAWAILQPFLFEPDAGVRGRAIEAVGRVAAVRARRDLEPAREIVRRALWLMNDESGGVLWAGPELIGAVLANVAAVRGEFLDVLASFLEEEPFRIGTRWALWRVALAAPAEVAAAAAGALAASLVDPDPAVRGHAALALAAAAGPGAAATVAVDPAPFELFDPREGSVLETTVGGAATGRALSHA
jgi:hypothetical protein